MNSLILQAATRLLVPLLLVISLWLLLRGHNEPGGGFIAGLVSAAAFSLYFIAFGVKEAQKLLGVPPPSFIAVGLLIALSSGVVSLLRGLPFMTGTWVSLSLPGLGATKIGTPIIFDFGVYLAVVGVVLVIVFNLAEE
jgi:multicomponent Na+:H+ antiporter subunit B